MIQLAKVGVVNSLWGSSYEQWEGKFKKSYTSSGYGVFLLRSSGNSTLLGFFNDRDDAKAFADELVAAKSIEDMDAE